MPAFIPKLQLESSASRTGKAVRAIGWQREKRTGKKRERERERERGEEGETELEQCSDPAEVK